jgi:hypothetical protein
MDRQHAIDALVEITVKELLQDTSQVFLKEFIRNGFLGYTKMSHQRLEQELVYRGLQEWWTEDYSWEDSEDIDDDDEPVIAIRNNQTA